jgi:hypothetical protein
VVASAALLDELLLHSAVKFKIFGSSIPDLLLVLTADFLAFAQYSYPLHTQPPLTLTVRAAYMYAGI